jgi:fucose permease
VAYGIVREWIFNNQENLRGASWVIVGIVGIIAIPIIMAWIEGKIRVSL